MNNVIFSYTRAEAIADGEQFEVSKDLLQTLGFKFPLLITSGIHEIIQQVLTNCANYYN
mgnify:FL=1